MLGIVLALHSIINGLLLRRPGNRELIHEKVALLVPARNEERNIRECLDTLENQRHLDQFSIFVLDDSSTDNTNKIIRERVNANSKIVLL